MDPNANLLEQESILERARTMRQINTGTLAGYHKHEPGYWVTEDWSEVIDTRGDRARLRELREALRDWIRGGGFEPDWAKAPNARKYYGK